MFELSLEDLLVVALPTIAVLVAYAISGHIARQSLKGNRPPPHAPAE
ncbi:MAG: hypothetical protein AAF253_03825 [Pseudomonadota bacterium]